MSSVWDRVEFFAPSEFTHPDEMDAGLLLRLDTIRRLSGVPIYVTSSFRPGDDKSHGRGYAVDISDNMEGEPVASRWRHTVLAEIYEADIVRVGVYDRHIHIDNDPTLPQYVTWWAVSK